MHGIGHCIDSSKGRVRPPSFGFDVHSLGGTKGLRNMIDQSDVVVTKILSLRRQFVRYFVVGYSGLGGASVVKDLTSNTAAQLLGQSISYSIQALSLVVICVALYYMIQYSKHMIGNKPYFYLVNSPAETFRFCKAGAIGFCILYVFAFLCRWFPQLSSTTYSDILMFTATFSAGAAYFMLEGNKSAYHRE